MHQILYAQEIPATLLSSDDPYHSEITALTFTFENSNLVIPLGGKDIWRYSLLENYKDSLYSQTGWKNLRDSISFHLKGSYTLMTSFDVKGLENKKKLILRIPPFNCGYSAWINQQKVTLHSTHILQNNIDITSYLKSGYNDLILKFNRCSISKFLPEFLKKIYIIHFQNLHISNLVVKGDAEIKAIGSRSQNEHLPGKRYAMLGWISKG